MKRATIGKILLMPMLGIFHMGSTVSMRNNYDSAINTAANAVSDKEKANYLRYLLHESMYTWNKRPIFGEVRKHISALTGVKRQFRLEVGNINGGSYEVAWVVETDRKVVVFSNMLSHRSLVRGNARRAEWDRLLQELSRSEKNFGCKSALDVSDGSAYFGTLTAGSNSRNFAVYGAITFPRGTTSERLLLQQLPCSEIVLKTYELVQSATHD